MLEANSSVLMSFVPKQRLTAGAVPVSGMNPTVGTCDKQVQMIGIARDHRYRRPLCCREMRPIRSSVHPAVKIDATFHTAFAS